MKKISWEFKMGLILITISLSIYAIKFITIGGEDITYNYIFNAFGFLPINVLLVTIVLNKLLSIRSQRDKLEKLNMVIGAFFSEVGTKLLAYISDYDPNLEEMKNSLLVTSEWSDEEYTKAASKIRDHNYSVNIESIDLEKMRDYLKRRREFMVRLLENPTVLEHGRFTELLRSAFHLAEELEIRKDLENMDKAEYEHLQGDIKRAYRNLANEWIEYMMHLKDNYPYLFSLAMRTNPFDEKSNLNL